MSTGNSKQPPAENLINFYHLAVDLLALLVQQTRRRRILELYGSLDPQYQAKSEFIKIMPFFLQIDSIKFRWTGTIAQLDSHCAVVIGSKLLWMGWNHRSVRLSQRGMQMLQSVVDGLEPSLS